MKNKSSKVNLGLLLEFKRAFPNEEPKEVEHYLSGGNKVFILNVAALLLGFKSHHSKFDDNKTLLEMFFSVENDAFVNEVYTKIKNAEDAGIRVKIVNQYTSLKLFEYYFNRPEQPEVQSKVEFERNLFKAYLIFNSQVTKAQDKAVESVAGLEANLKAPMQFFCLYYPIADKVNYDIDFIHATQIIKAVYLFQYLESNPKTQGLLKSFLTYFDKASWQEYLTTLLSLTVRVAKNEHEAHVDIEVQSGEDFEEVCTFIEKLSVKNDDYLEPYDFLTLRSTPFYKVGNGIYRVIFDLFLVEKIFKGVYFLLRDINKNLPAETRLSDVRGMYCHEFSEKLLMYEVLKEVFVGKFIRFSGQDFDDRKLQGYPDYYLRKRNKILLVESKDFLIRADLKATFNYDIYEQEFAKTLYYEEKPDGKIKAGAVLQLVGSIKKLLKKEFAVDTDYYYRDIEIYPVLITHDHQYDTPGFSNLINYWFKFELDELAKDGYFIHRIKPLTVVNIDSLLFHQTVLGENVSLFKILDEYHHHVKQKLKPKLSSIEELDKIGLTELVPFSLFIDNYFIEQGLRKAPKIVAEINQILFKNEA